MVFAETRDGFVRVSEGRTLVMRRSALVIFQGGEWKVARADEWDFYCLIEVTFVKCHRIIVLGWMSYNSLPFVVFFLRI